jgi:hypothetical protein
VLGVADLLAGVDVDKDGHWSLSGFARPAQIRAARRALRDFLGPDGRC